MGNRGVLHNANGELTAKRWTHQQWIICLLEFKGPKRQLRAPGSYTELFFLDEPTALAAGHRPCWECNRERYNQFKAAWVAGNPEYGFTPKVSIKEIDLILHRERVASVVEKDEIQVKLGCLPDGVFVSWPDQPQDCYLIQGQRLKLWSPAGYLSEKAFDPEQLATVLTPKSTVNALRAGYRLF